MVTRVLFPADAKRNTYQKEIQKAGMGVSIFFTKKLRQRNPAQKAKFMTPQQPHLKQLSH